MAMEDRVVEQVVLSKWAVELIQYLGILALDDGKSGYTCLLQASNIIPEGWQREVYLRSVRRGVVTKAPIVSAGVRPYPE